MMSSNDYSIDPAARMHAMFSEARPGEFTVMEGLRTKYKRTARDAVLAEGIDALLRAAVQRTDQTAAPGFNNRSRGTGLALIGPTGVGKSRALERYFDKHPVLQGYRDPASKSPLLSVSAPSPCTSMALARLILRASGYPIERDLRAHRLWEMVWDRLELLQKFLLHIDELQHVVQYITERERQEVANILKHGMHDRRISLIISGVDELKPFLDFDPQLLRRLTVKAFDPITPDSIGEVESMVKDYAAAAGLDLELEEKGVVRHDFHLRLAQSAMNAFGYAIVVTHLAIEVALHENSTTLTRNHFATMYAQKTNATADRNPFLASQWHTIDCKTLFQKTATYLPPAPASRKRAKCVS